MRQWTGSALVQKIACRLFGAKPIIKTNAGILPLDTKEQTYKLSEILIKYKTFHLRKYIWKYHLCIGGHFVQGEMS